MTRLLAVLTALTLTGAGVTGCAGGSAVPSDTRSITQAGTASAEPSSAPVSPIPTAGNTPPAPSTDAASAGAAGIRGTTVVDGCPVVRDPPCPDKPVAAQLSITDPAGAVVATVTSGTDGQFRIALKPGRYVIHPMTPTGGLPRAPAPVNVTVGPGGYTTVTIRFDSGMR